MPSPRWVVLVGIAGTMAGLPYLDAIAAFMVALMIAQIAWELGWAAVNELVDTGLESHRVDAVRETIRSAGRVRDILCFAPGAMGAWASADVHVLVDPSVSVSEGHVVSMPVEERIKREIDEITDVTVHIDPQEDDEQGPPNAHLPRARRYWPGWRPCGRVFPLPRSAPVLFSTIWGVRPT